MASRWAAAPASAILGGEQPELDEALEAIYSGDSDQDISRDEWESPTSGRPARRGEGPHVPEGRAAGSTRSATSSPRTSSSCCRRTPSSGAA